MTNNKMTDQVCDMRYESYERRPTESETKAVSVAFCCVNPAHDNPEPFFQAFEEYARRNDGSNVEFALGKFDSKNPPDIVVVGPACCTASNSELEKMISDGLNRQMYLIPVRCENRGLLAPARQLISEFVPYRLHIENNLSPNHAVHFPMDCRYHIHDAVRFSAHLTLYTMLNSGDDIRRRLLVRDREWLSRWERIVRKNPG
jgi:hypothetical protein